MEQLLVGKEELSRQFEDFFNTRKKAQIAELVSKFPAKKSLEVEFHELEVFDTELADAIVETPDKLIQIAEETIAAIGATFPGAQKNFKPHLRIYNLPQVHDVPVQSLGAGQLDKLVRVEGVVSWITDINPRMEVATWECMHCWQTMITKTEKVEAVKPPAQCKCGRNHFKLIEEKSVFTNVQRARIQELVEKLRGNTPTAHVDMWMEDDLANQIAPGEKLVVTGTLRLKPAKEGKGKSSVYNKFLDVVHVHKMQQEFEELEISKEETRTIQELASQPDVVERITRSIAPSIYGYNELKQAIALQMFGGTPNKILPDGQRIRNDAHILLIGDPGCLVADERIALGNGAIVKIGEIGKEHLQRLNLRVFTGQGGGKCDTATTFFAYKKQLVMEVVTESGKSIKGTYNHPLLCLETHNGAIVEKWKKLDEMKIGDKLATTSYIPCTITRYIPTGFATLEKPHFGPSFKGKLPTTVTPELAELLGYMLGDGWVREKEADFVVAEPEKDILQPLVKKCQRLFSIEPHAVRKVQNGRTVPMYYVTISSKDVAHNLLFLREKRVPDLILQSGNKVAAAFLRWLFEADGTVFNNGRGRRAIGLKAKNIELLRDVQMLLLRFAIHSRIIENALLVRRGKDIIKFAEKIGFVSKKKKAKLKNLAASAKDFARVGQQRSERIVKIIHHTPEDVFDIEVPSSHRFIANGIVSHNSGKSAILQYTARLAPKGVFVSGKGASGVGLTAAAEKDELTGGWILKAGAMVLASGGMVMIDEFDKMEDEDRSALHEALEQQSISIAKAGMVTTFQTKAAVLAAANPKFGRFDPNTPPAQQFEIPPTLLSRFDLIFTIRDVLDESQDRKIADHIILGHTLAGKKEKPGEENAVMAVIPEELLRKYIAYARRTSFPTLTAEAADKIKEFYLELRQMGKKNSTFPVTARDIEGVIRFAEASAKVRLSPRVELQDAERAIALKMFVLRDVFTDKETGLIDSDIISIGQPKSKVDKLRTLLSIISSLEKEFDLVDIDKVVEQTKEANIDEHTARKMIDELKRAGDLYEPKAGFVKSARKKGEW